MHAKKIPYIYLIHLLNNSNILSLETNLNVELE